MIEDGRQVPDGSVLGADLCIIGGGAAGIAMSRALRGSGLDIVVLESGGLEFDERTNDLNRGQNIGEPMTFWGVERPLHDVRLRYFGGSTNHWFGWCRPIDPMDLEHRPWVPYSGWPISRADIDPWLPAAHEIAELGPVEYDPRVWARRYGAPKPLLSTDVVATTMFQYSPPTNFGERYRADLDDAADVRVLLWSNAVNLDASVGADHVNGVDVIVLDGPRFRVESGAVVLATGGIEVPRLLLASRGVQPEGLANGNDLVGRYFMEHPHMKAGVAVTRKGLKALSLHQIRPYDVEGRQVRARGVFTLTPAAQREHQTLNFSTFVLGETTPQPLKGREPSDMVSDTQVADLVRRYGPAMRSVLEFEMISEGAPSPDSRVLLGDELDELGMPRVQVDWRRTPLDRYTIQTGLELLGSELGRLGLGRMLVESDGLGPMKADVDVGSHHMGTTRMSSDAASGVVDSDCRVHGIDNLFVAGSAVYPTGGSANPTLTLLALAFRLADHLKRTIPA
ncbi:MAG: GMC family oxidoreductase [Chloroflexota bacterium]